MAKVRVKLLDAGMREMLKSPGVLEELRSRMVRVKAALGPGAMMERAYRPSRVVVKVIKGSNFDEANTGELSRALDLAGGRRGTKIRNKKPKRNPNG